MGTAFDNMFVHPYMWPFIILAFLHWVYTTLRNRKERMDYAEKLRRDEIVEEKPWDAN